MTRTAGLWRRKARIEQTAITEDRPPNMYEYYASFSICLTRFNHSLEGIRMIIIASQRRIEVSTDRYTLILLILIRR